MKIIKPVLLLTFAVVLASCSNIKGNQENNGKQLPSDKKTEITIKPEQLTYEAFLQKVWNFEEHPDQWVYEGTEPCVIDFYADWCGPCRRVAPIMEEMAKKYNGKVKVYKVNVDKEQKLAAVFRINSIPAVLFSPMNGKPMMQVGLLPNDYYSKIIDEHLLNIKTEKK
ncbi:MAG: thioredoxin [Bacteroidales bacterium]|nr:thioredoxin [Bacteroidales bacterium]